MVRVSMFTTVVHILKQRARRKLMFKTYMFLLLPSADGKAGIFALRMYICTRVISMWNKFQ